MPVRLILLRTLVASLSLAALPVTAASFDVTQGAWGDASTVNSLAWAIQQANATPGADSILFHTDVNVDQANPIPFTGGFLAEITDPAGLSIRGNGFSLVGNPTYISGLGVIVTKNNPQPYSSTGGGNTLVVEALSFARIADNVSNVSIDNLVVDGLNGFLRVGSNSVVSISDSFIKNSVNFGNRSKSVIQALADSVVNLTSVNLHNINPFEKPIPFAESIWFGAISGDNATLNIFKSTLDLFSSSTAGAVNWVGGTANLVSSVITGQGLSIADDAKQGVLNLVNSVFRPDEHSATARLQAFNGGEANVTASTIQYDALFTQDVPSGSNCPGSYLCNGAPLQAFAGGAIHLRSSAVSVLNENIVGIVSPYSDTYNSLPGSLTADAYSFVQPVATQDAAALRLLFAQPGLRTAPGAYELDATTAPLYLYLDLPGGAYPAAYGPLTAVIPDANGANKLINPIDGTVISTDVFGNPRTFNGLRDIGAAQAGVPAPLPVLSVATALGWSRRLRRRIQRQSGAAPTVS